MMFRDIIMHVCQLKANNSQARLCALESFSLFSMPKKRANSTSETRLPTLSDVAAEAGVSRSAVARVLLGTGGESVRVGEQTQALIQKVAQRMSYAPNRNAQQLKGASSRTLGVIVSTENARVMSERVFAIEKAAAERGYRILVGRVRGGQAQLDGYVSDFIGRGVDAIFCLFDLDPGRDERVGQAFRSGYRKVVFHGRAAWPGGLAVQIDVASAIRAAVDHLVERGKRRPALALWNAERDELMDVRRRAFEAALSAHGLSMASDQIWDAASADTNPDSVSMDRGVEAMVTRGHADAILASNDVWAVRFIQTLKARGVRVPEDVAIVGYDNLDIASVVEPSLSSVNPNHEAYAEACLDLLLQVVESGETGMVEQTAVITPRLVVRHST